MTEIALHIILGIFGFGGWASAIVLLADRRGLQERLDDLKAENRDLRTAERKRDPQEPPPKLADPSNASKIFEAHLEKKWPKEKQICPICGSCEWGASGVAGIHSFDGKSVVLFGGTVYPVVLLVCTGCGHMLTFSAIMAGIVETNKEKA